MLGLVKAMAPQCGQMNIRVNAIAPGLIRTHFSSAVSKSNTNFNWTCVLSYVMKHCS